MDPEILKQFILDAPRIDIILEGEVYQKDPEILKDYLYQQLDITSAEKVIYLLTQTFLAKFYIEEYKKHDEIGEHLLDHTRYIVSIDTKKKIINLTKDFKIVYFYYDDEVYYDYIVDYCTLNIFLDLEEKLLIYDWNYEFDNNPVILNKMFT